jgi:hypothetical protein
MISIGLILMGLLILLVIPVNSAPAPHIFVVNDELKLGATFWLGDEFHMNKLPDGWRAYDDDWEIYEDGGKQVKPASEYGDLESFCDSLGYRYVGGINEDWTHQDTNSDKFEQQSYQWFGLLILGIIALIGLFYILFKRKIK